MKLSEQAVVVFALGLQKVLALDTDYGEMLKKFEFSLDENNQLKIDNFELARITKEDFESKFGSYESEDNTNDLQLDLFSEKIN